MKYWIFMVLFAFLALSCGGGDSMSSDDDDDNNDNDDNDNDNDDNDNDDNDNNDNDNDNNDNNDDDNNSSDTDSDSDSDSDSDADSDTDSDTDSDSDSDSDGDTDTSTSTDDSNFSFFVISMDSIIEQCNNQEGCGGDLGGLDGADDMCQYAAEKVGAGNKTWVAFLSVNDYNGTGPVNAIDRLGEGPWYNVDGLLLAENKTGLLQMRPDGATDIVYSSGFQEWPFNQCLTDEFGDCVLSYGDSHDTLTGSDRDGTLYKPDDATFTCNNWTSTTAKPSGGLWIGHTWPRQLDATQEDVANWIRSHQDMGGDCQANINISEVNGEVGVGGSGGYGGFYCFADLNKTK